jgi:hypothetical protein
MGKWARKEWTIMNSVERSGIPEPVLGLRENLAQFSLLVLVNAFVGGMVGPERAILPLIAQREFGMVSKSVILSGIVADRFGVVWAIVAIGGLTFVSGVVVAVRMSETHRVTIR